MPDPAQSADAVAEFAAISQELFAIDNDAVCPDLIDALFEVGQRYHFAGKVAMALRAGARAAQLVRETDDRHRTRRALSLLGNFQLHANDHASAAATLLEALHVAKDLNEPGVASPVWNNLGLLFQQLGQYKSAIKCFETSIKEAATSDRFSGVNCIAWSNVANCAMHLRELEPGLRAARRSLELNPNPTRRDEIFSHLFAEHQLVRLLLEQGNLEEARSSARYAHEHADNPVGLNGVYAELTVGLLDVYSGRTDLGLTSLSKVCELMRRTQPAIYPEALSALIAGFEAAGQSDAALVHLHEMLSTLRAAQGERLLGFLAKAETAATPAAPDAAYERMVSAKAVSLEVQVHASVAELVSSAITGLEQAGHDRFHLFRVSKLVETFALSLGWDAELARELAFASRLMDIGMLVIPSAISQKPRGLSDGERKILYEHTQFGAEVLSKAGLAILQSGVPLARFHHERWDGGGPWGVKGEAIPIGVRIATLCDAFAALISTRPWRASLQIPRAVHLIEGECGSRFDPELGQRFAACLRDLYWMNDDFDAFLTEDATANAYVRTREQIDRLIRAAACGA